MYPTLFSEFQLKSLTTLNLYKKYITPFANGIQVASLPVIWFSFFLPYLDQYLMQNY